MSKVILTVGYEIHHEKRDDYISLMNKLKEVITSKNNCSYSIYETIGRKNKFSEVYIFNSKEDYDNFDDQQEAIEEIVNQINNEFVKEGKISSTQMLEVL
jgi:quinol monooxygenase YgiN